MNLKNLTVIGLLAWNLLTVIGASTISHPGRIEDANFWRSYGENHLEKILKRISDGGNHHLPIARNIIIFIGDGMGMTTLTAGRIFKGQTIAKKSGEEENLAVDDFPNIGLAKTYNVDKQVPDSAGTATAIFSGVKTRYGVIGMDNTTSSTDAGLGKLTSIMDWSQSVGKRTGIVTTTRITHATPAALYANIYHRDWECDTKVPEDSVGIYKDIARQLVEDLPGKRLNVILAGGKRPMGSTEPEMAIKDQIKFDGDTEKVCYRADGRNLIQEWLELPITSAGGKRIYVGNRNELLHVDTDRTNHLLGLFASNHLSYAIVRPRAIEPTLTEMTESAIKILDKPNSTGFVLMVEAGRIDQAHHQNHARAALTDFLEMDKAIEKALALTDASETLIIVTADHSHAMTLNGYPTRGNDILGFANKNNVAPYETLSYANGPGYWDHRWNISSDTRNLAGTWIQVESLTSEVREHPKYRHLATLPLKDETHGGEDVPVYATGPGSQLIQGVFEQSFIAYAISYAGCFGPAMHLNLKCPTNQSSMFDSNGSTNNSNSHHISLTSLSCILYLFAIVIYCF